MDLTGTTISHYSILQKIGEGGMGVVYRAHDTALDRQVALKFLPERAIATDDARARFVREARTAASIDHPNVCTIYEVGETPEGRIFIAMALYQGETLQAEVSRGPLPIERVLDVATQAAEGLRAAHEKGVVHRDVKCGNIMVTEKGQVKIMDFGLAAGAGFERLTLTGSTVGTVHCMSPEQARGEPVDQRTDIWALGVVIYEMIAGKLPFRSDYAEALIYAILHETPESPATVRSDVPPGISRIVFKALAKNAADRYQTAGDLLKDLRVQSGTSGSLAQTAIARMNPFTIRRLIPAASTVLILFLAFLVLHHFLPRGTPAAAGRFIAVLPLENLGGRPDDQPFCDGMTESIMTSIAGVPGLSVIDRNSAFRYKNRPADIHQIGNDLGVNFVLEGSVQRSEKRLRVNAHLVNVASGFDIWAEKFDRDVSDLFAVQDDIAGRVVSALEVTFEHGAPEGVRHRPTSNMDAYDRYLRGRFLAATDDSTNLEQAISLLKEAIALDPRFALAYAGLGQVYQFIYFARGPQGDVLQEAVLSTEKAIALDSTLAEGYVTRGNLLWNRSSRFSHEEAIREERRALRLNPNLASAHQSLGGIYFHIGLLDEALQELRTALMLDPLNVWTPPRIARIYRYMGKFDSSQAIFGKLTAGEWAHEKAMTLHGLGRDREAFDLLAESVRENRGVVSSDDAGAYAVLYAAAGNRVDAERNISLSIQRGEKASHFHHAEFNIACAYAILGENPKSVAWLRRTADDGMPCFPLFLNDPSLQSLHADTSYTALMEQMKNQLAYFRKLL